MKAPGLHRWWYVAAAGVVMSGLVLASIVTRGQRPTGGERPAADPSGTPCPSASGASFDLSFVATDTGREQIYLQDAPGASVVRIVDLPGAVSDPAWSPDGRRVAFRWYRQGRRAPNVYVANADGSRLRPLVRQAAMPSWSPNGRRIAFANLRRGERGISIVTVAQALRGVPAITVVTRTGDAVPEERPTWSPDGRHIAFTSHRDGSSDIWTVAADGSELRNLTADEPSLDTTPTWSPDGELIAFGSTRGSSSVVGGDIYVMRPDGSEVRRLTSDDGAFAPAWSPDGCAIAFNSNVTGTSQIYVMRSDGSNIEQLTTAHADVRGDPTFACCAAWRAG